jgi:hypothetical protein
LFKIIKIFYMTEKRGDRPPDQLSAVSRDYHSGPAEVPEYIFKYTPTEVLSSGHVVIPEVKIENEFEVETTRFNGGVFVRLPKRSGENEFRLCQDAGALGLDENNRIVNFAMGDGVGQSTNGKAASERATSLALRELSLDSDISYTDSVFKNLVKRWRNKCRVLILKH